MAVLASDSPSSRPHSLLHGLAGHQPSRRHHAQFLLCPSFHDPRTPHVLESHPERAAPLSRRDDDRRHAVGSYSTLALRLSILQPATPPPVVAFESWTISAPVCLNRFTFAGSWKPDLFICVCVFIFPFSAFAFLIGLKFSFKSLFAIWSLSTQRFHYYFYLGMVSWQYQKY